MSDLIRREDAIGACAYETFECYEARKAIRNLPSADRPQKVIAQITFDEEKLREIVKEAVERFKEEYEITDRPRGEWIDRGMRVPSSWVKKCSLCGYETDTWRWCNFCPHCGARMKGADDE